MWIFGDHSGGATAILIDRLASASTTIRVGSGGVMLPNHPPLVVAEQFGTLGALHSGRIDLGIGRAPGTDPITARALRRTADFGANDFPHQLDELMHYMNRDSSGHIAAVPAPENWPPLWLLGTSPNTAALAGAMGVPFAFAHHLRPDATAASLQAYRESFQPSAHLAEPYAIVAAVVSAADTDERAEWLLGPMKLAFALGAADPKPFHSPEDAAKHSLSAEQELRVQAQFGPQIVGSPETVRDQVGDLVSRTGADELMALTVIHDHEERVRSYELLAEAVRQSSGDRERVDAG
ncbi:LLM class flavin-dependent oxidoreductase [Saccharopolyspora hirsuta]|uniref:LLM class flavin-dependent oxidoreductase n=1 Tax=Saccharopolyspora hirsuta TaxID=1837 RepID=UPI0014780D0D|nr:LLM class flavin-dependent oxidoreductase [Saccharopolyspora hirsuta]